MVASAAGPAHPLRGPAPHVLSDAYTRGDMVTAAIPSIVHEGTAIVLRGSFNPAIFHPEWYRARGLLSEPEIQEAEIKIVSQQVSSFTTNQFEFFVSDDAFQIATNHPPAYELLRDLVLGTFKILSHTPIRLMGLNRQVHVDAGPEDRWNDIGNRLAPKRYWERVLQSPGTRSITIEGVRPDNYSGYVRVKFE